MNSISSSQAPITPQIPAPEIQHTLNGAMAQKEQYLAKMISMLDTIQNNIAATKAAYQQLTIEQRNGEEGKRILATLSQQNTLGEEIQTLLSGIIARHEPKQY